MENGGWIVILILVVLVGGVNLFAFAAVRGAFRDGGGGLADALNKTFLAPRKNEDEIEELRRRLKEIEEGKKKDAQESK